jgi:RNA recognition motif-containing protein
MIEKMSGILRKACVRNLKPSYSRVQKSVDKKEIRMNIYVGNVSYNVSETDLRSSFEAFGQVASLNLMKDKYSGRSRGFAFVEMPDKAEGESVIRQMNGKDLKGRTLKVDEARPRSEGRREGGRRGEGRRYY